MNDRTTGITFDASRLSPSQVDGFACVKCGADFLASSMPSVVAGTTAGGQVFACLDCPPSRTDSPHCPVAWCAIGTHTDTAHFAPVVDFEMTGNVDIAIYVSESERSGLCVTVDLHVGDEEGGLQLDLGPGRAYALAQILAALDPAAVLQFAEQLRFAAVTLDPSVSGEVAK